MKQAVVNITAFLLAFALCTWAGWDTTLFDGSSKRRGYGYERTLQTYTGIVERLNAAYDDGTNFVTVTPRRWGSSWTLQEAKSDLETMLADDLWSDKHELSGGNYNTWFSSGTNEFPILDTDYVESLIGAQTNWFDFHPHWGAVTHTNGWQFLDDALNELVVYVGTGPSSDHDLPWFIRRYKFISEERYPNTYEAYEDTWDKAKTFIETNYTDNAFIDATTNTATGGSLIPEDFTSGYLTTYTSGGYDPDDINGMYYSAYASSHRFKVWLTNSAPFTVEFVAYWKGVAPSLSETSIASVFNPYSSGIDMNHTAIFKTTIPSGGTYQSDWIGEYWETGADIIWCADPSTATENNIDEGFEHTIYGNKSHANFEILNGFEYVE